MSSNLDPANAALAALNAAVSMFADLDLTLLDNRQRVEMLRQLETVRRRLPAIGDQLLHDFSTHNDDTFGGEHPAGVIADTLRITRAEATRRFRTAADLARRSSITGEPLEPELSATAAAAREGTIGDAHVQVIRSFLHHLPAAIDPGTRAQAEHQLADCARTLRPDELRAIANRLAGYLNPDGEFSDRDRKRTRTVHLGAQGCDGMSTLSGRIDPELRAYLEAVFAKLARPGVANPDDENPAVDGEPDDDSTRRDDRTPGQRRHDALKAICRSTLSAGRLGQHRGLPVTVIATTSVRELSEQSGVATTAGGSLLPMSDLIRMAGHAYHHLAIFDGSGRVLHLGRAKRIASADQRIVLHARDRGCTFPGCDAPGYLTEAHHLDEWADGGRTDLDNLTLVCGRHHRLAGPGPHQWQAHRTRVGRTAWVPPWHVDPRQRLRINGFHHPAETLMRDGEEACLPP